MLSQGTKERMTCFISPGTRVLTSPSDPCDLAVMTSSWTVTSEGHFVSHCFSFSIGTHSTLLLAPGSWILTCALWVEILSHEGLLGLSSWSRIKKSVVPWE